MVASSRDQKLARELAIDKKKKGGRSKDQF